MKKMYNPRQPGGHKYGNAHRFLMLAAVAINLSFSGCAGPPALKQAVIGYDETTARLDQQLLLINIARIHSGLPIHFTTTSSIAATFDWTATIGLEDESKGGFTTFNLGGRASENPTFSIVPITGEEFTKRILTPFPEEIFNFTIFEGERVDQLLRLMSDGIEFQNPDGSFVRIIANDPGKPRQYEEFRRVASHLQWLFENQQLFVRRLVFDDILLDDFADNPRSQDVKESFDSGVRWEKKGDGSYRLTQLTTGRLVVTNYDPLALSDAERGLLNDSIVQNPKSFIYLDIRPGYPGGDYPMRGAIKLRSLVQVIKFVSNAISQAPEFEVEPDPRTGPAGMGLPDTLKILVTDSAPDSNVPSVEYDGKYYSIGDSQWDRTSFMILSYLFQTAIGVSEAVGIPITISK